MKTILFYNIKGGSGKTTSALYVTQELLNRGYSVKFTDADPSQQASAWIKNGSLPVTPTGDYHIIDAPPNDTSILKKYTPDLVIVPSQATSLDLRISVKLVKTLQANGYQTVILLTRLYPKAAATLEAVRIFTEADSKRNAREVIQTFIDRGHGVKDSRTIANQANTVIKRTGDYSKVTDMIVRTLA